MTDKKRLLAAIMFADMVGYTKLMQENETQAKSNRDKVRSLLEDRVSAYNGEIVQYYGDGALCIFESAVEAARSATELQQALVREGNIPVRIGLHIGDIVQDDDGIFGDGVNVASRIESLALPGSVFISDKLNDHLHNQENIQTVSLGKVSLKNVASPVEIFAVTAKGLKQVSREEISLSPAEEKSIAVLPFVNMSADKDNEYFSDGITEEILNALAKLGNLRVTSRTSSFAFKNRNIDIREIGSQLNVSSILEGSVRKAGNKVRITAQLINTADGYHVFSEVYDRDLQDIFAVQDEISNKIANTLKAKLSLEDKDKQLVAESTQNMEAYNLYLKGVYYYNKWTPEAAHSAIKILIESLELDPENAPAYVALASCYLMMGAMGITNAAEAYDSADQYITSALKINENLPEALLAKGFVYFYRDWDLNSCGRYLQSALDLKPGSADIHTALSLYLLATDRFDEAIEAGEKALILDPLSLPIITSNAYILFCIGQYKNTVSLLTNVLKMDPNFRSAHELIGWCQLYLGEPDKAIESIKKFQIMSNDELKGIGGLGYIYAKSGDTEKAQACLNMLKEHTDLEKNITLDMEYILLYTVLGDLDIAFKYVESSLSNKIGILQFQTHPFAEEIRQDPRFEELVRTYLKK